VRSGQTAEELKAHVKGLPECNSKATALDVQDIMRGLSKSETEISITVEELSKINGFAGLTK
jgi:hypothetical protein